LQCKVTYLWEQPSVRKSYRTAVSLHGHTNHSRESLYFIVEFASRYGLLRRALATQEKRARYKKSITVDFWKGYWTPPLTALSAFQLERNQIEQTLGLAGMVSLTDHDSIEAPMLLRVIPEARQIPVSVEWSVPFGETVLHLGIHNLPSGRAEMFMTQFADYTRKPDRARLTELLAALHQNPDILVILNHPMWDLAGIGRPRHVHNVSAFLAKLGMYIHAFELGGLRNWDENQRVVQLAEGWNQPIIAGGDRHGCEASAVLNLTEAACFTEFVHQIRKERRSHVLFMPQYKEPFGLRILQSVLDVIRDYPDYPEGSRRWDERVFHPDSSGVIQPVSQLWQKPPAFIEAVFSGIRLLEVAPVRRAMEYVLNKPEHEMRFMLGRGQQVAS
jgi:hypothetical protein